MKKGLPANRSIDPGKPILRFDWIDDETCDVTLTDKPVITMDHGAHGWDGMIAIRRALLTVADLMGYGVVVNGDEGV